MKRAVLVATLVASLGGCVTMMGLARKDRVTKPVLITALVADLVVGSLLFAQPDSLSTAGAIGSALAVTAVDLGIGCIIGACAVLRP